MQVSRTASAVNYVQVTGAATTAAPTISAQGSDAAVDLTLNTKSTGTLRLQSNSTTRVSINSGGTVALGISASGGSGLQVIATGSQVNFATVLGSITGQIPTFSMANSSDTNVGLGIVTKGTGAINLAAGSRGVNISNGGTVTAITRTSSGGSYTSIPSVAISAPTTAGGVQATASAAMFIQTVSIVNGGTGYAVGNVLTVVGGTVITAATLTVSSVSAGVITGVTVTTGGTSYTVLPSNPVSVTGGAGSGATFNVTSWAVSATITITNAGSGYIEQPTVTFSGGGGSGAAAYATVGSGTIFKTIGNTLSFNTPAGEAVRVIDNGATTVNYWQFQGRQSTGGILASAQGTDSNIAAFISSKGTGNVTLATNNFAQTQFNVSHTASAVNYVQVTGGATSNSPVISAQGSDTNITLGITPKGSGLINLNAQTRLGFNSTNYITIAGSATTVSPTISALGGDTNIDLALTPKGTGLVRFGTYVAGALTATGYINIKAADGTTYKVLVST
jgi:hypothetical protein